MRVTEKVAAAQELPQFKAVRDLHTQARQRWTIAELCDILATRGPMGVVSAVSDWAVGAWNRALSPTVRTLRLAGEATATAGVQAPPSEVRKLNVRFSFDEVNQNSVNAARDFRNNLISGASADTATAVQLAVSDGIAQGRSPEWIAQRVRLVMALTPRQAQALINYANGLEARNTAILSRAVNPAIEADVRERWGDERPATAAQVNRLVADYGARLVDQRATTIARTETLRAANLGSELSVRQAQDEGLFGEFELRRFWVDTPDEKTRADHRAVPKLNPDGVALDEPFVYPGGRTIMRPGDPNADADMVVNCRCTVAFKLVRRR